MGRWVVETNGVRDNRVYHLSRAEAVAAGVTAVIEENFSLLIQGSTLNKPDAAQDCMKYSLLHSSQTIKPYNPTHLSYLGRYENARPTSVRAWRDWRASVRPGTYRVPPWRCSAVA